MIAAVADIHLRNIDEVCSLIPEGTRALIVAGDVMSYGDMTEFRYLCLLFSRFVTMVDEVLFVPGNHDCIFADPLYAQHCRGHLGDLGVTVGVNEVVSFQNRRVLCCSYTPLFRGWAYEASENVRIQFYRDITEKVDMVVSHCPPFGVLDEVGGRRLGCVGLRNYLEQNSYEACVTGHIHEHAGAESYILGTRVINCSYTQGSPMVIL